MAKQAGFWSIYDCLAEISAGGDPLETLKTAVDFEHFRRILEHASGKPRRAKGGRPSLDVVLKFRMLDLQSLHGLSLDMTERMVRDRLSWMRFCGLGIADTVPDANTLWDFREALIRAEALEALFEELDRAINQAGFIPRAVRSSMRASLLRRANATRMARRRPSRRAVPSRKSGPTSRQKPLRRTRPHVGRSNIQRRRRARIAASRWTSRSRPSATRTIFRSTGSTGSFGANSSPMPRSTMELGCARDWCRRRIPGARSGRIPPIGRPRTRPGLPTTAWRARSTARNPAVDRCRR